MTPDLLSPANHRLVDVLATYEASDASGASSCALTVSSNEPANGRGDGNTTVDWLVIDAHHVQLRAERSDLGRGRIYTLTAVLLRRCGKHVCQVRDGSGAEVIS